MSLAPVGSTDVAMETAAIGAVILLLTAITTSGEFHVKYARMCDNSENLQAAKVVLKKYNIIIIISVTIILVESDRILGLPQ